MPTLPEIIRQGKTVTVNFGGLEEFWACVKTRPLSRISECTMYLTGKEEIELDIQKLLQQQKVPVAVKLKPDWTWFVLGFLTAWILKK